MCVGQCGCEEICYCMEVKACIVRQAIKDGAITVPQIKRKTTACSMCGSCKDRILEILKEEGCLEDEEIC